jgi:hypothetical protein
MSTVILTFQTSKSFHTKYYADYKKFLWMLILKIRSIYNKFGLPFFYTTCTHVKISHNCLKTRCVRNRQVASLSTSCLTMLLFDHVATSWQVVEFPHDNKLLEQLVTWQVCCAQQPCSTLSTSRWKLVNKLGTSSANTSCWQIVGPALLQVCCRFVATCPFLRVYHMTLWLDWSRIG